MINLTNNRKETVFIYQIINEDLHQIGILKPNECLLKELKKNQKLEFKLSNRVGNYIVPAKTFQTVMINDSSFIIIN